VDAMIHLFDCGGKDACERAATASGSCAIGASATENHRYSACMLAVWARRPVIRAPRSPHSWVSMAVLRRTI